VCSSDLKQVEISVEGFYKQLDRQVVPNADRTASLSSYSNQGSGYAAGAEVLLKYKPDKRFFGWLAYTLSRSERRHGADEEPHLVPFDQPHILTVLGSFRLGKGWEAGARFRLVSGSLRTPNVCSVELASCDATRINALYHGASGVYTPIPFGAVSSERLPLFHALDVRVDKRFTFAAWKFSFYVDIQNIYNQENAETLRYNFNFTERAYTTGLPILPSIGLRGEF
jgi:outer membrane receptor protein involved in Fe transport